ncbi:MAG: FtsX-like permease family protein, partial [Pyrinomonadaceae bacterium]
AASKGAHITFSTAGDGEFPLATFTRQVLESSNEKLRDVQYTSAASCVPLGTRMKTISIQRLDHDLPPRSIHFCAVSQGFFQTMGNPILEGRGFSTNQFTGDASEVVINHRLADELWPGEDPLHHIVRVEEPSWGLQYDAEVIGIAQDMRFSGLTSTPDATVFLPLKGNVFSLSMPLHFLARGMESPKSFAELVQLQASISFPSLGVSKSYRIDERLQQSFMEQKARVWFIALGAALIAMIAYTGLYGVLIHSVNSKRKEMAIRSCFGASAGDLRKIIIRQALRCSAAAVVISLLAWKPMLRLVSSGLLGKVELSWQLVVVIPLLCLATAVGISLFPASAAAKVSLAEVLKDQ